MGGTGHTHDHARAAEGPASPERGMRAVLFSFGLLLGTAAVQAALVLRTGSVALLADTIHNAGDAATALPLWIAFRLARRRPSPRFPYGYGRAEDLAGLLIVGVVFASALLAVREAAVRLAAPVPVTRLGTVALASLLGFSGNEAAARYRIRVGRQIGSAALVADGMHARADALTSLGVLAGAAGVWLGYPAADPVAGILIAALILRIAWKTGREVLLRLLDGIDPAVPEEIRRVAAGTEGVEEVSEVRVRWAGHRMFADVHLAVDGAISVSRGHGIAKEARHRLLHRLPYLHDATVHVDPPEASGPGEHGIPSHAHDGEPDHGH